MPLLLTDIQQTEVGKVDLAHVDMDCEAIVAFTSTNRSSDRVPTIY